LPGFPLAHSTTSMLRPEEFRTFAVSLRGHYMREFVVFIAMRVACAALTYGAYLLLLMWASYEWAYAISYVSGIALAYFTNMAWVFKKATSRSSALRFPVVYLIQFLIGLLILKLLIEGLGIPEWLGLGLSVLITLPITYLLSRWAAK